MTWPGLLAFGFFALHAGHYLYRGQPEHILWACHLACVWIGVGWLTQSPTCLAIGVLWLILGIPFWLIDLASGGEFVWTTLLTHVGGSILGGFGIARLGMPDQVWWKALAALVVLQQVCRWITPAAANVNLAFAVYPGWETWFPTYWSYWLFLFGVAAAVFFVSVLVLARWVAS